MKKRVGQYISGRECPTGNGKRLKREARSVKFAGLDIAEFGDLTVLKLKDLLMPVAHGEYGTVSDTSKGHVLEKAAREAAVEQRVAAGGSAHKSAPDVRRTPNLSDDWLLSTSPSPRDRTRSRMPSSACPPYSSPPN